MAAAPVAGPAAPKPEEDLITLRFTDESQLECRRDLLVDHSDYFAAMFRFGFEKHEQAVVNLVGVEYDIIKTILISTYEPTHIDVIDPDELFPVLQTAIMLMFCQVTSALEDRMIHLVSFENCFQLWLNRVLHSPAVRRLNHKAKLMSLMQFDKLKDLPCFLGLSLEELKGYLSHINLYCPHEAYIFQAIGNWYLNLRIRDDNLLHSLLGCINFASCVPTDIAEMLEMPNSIAAEGATADILRCIHAIRSGEEIESDYMDSARALIGTRERNLGGFPCIFVHNRTQEVTDHLFNKVYYIDKFKRKRKYRVLHEKEKDFNVYHIDPRSKRIDHFYYLELNIAENLEGYGMLGYKNSILLFGGQRGIKKSSNNSWSCRLNVFEILHRDWDVRIMPYSRRHFQSCIVGHLLFVVGGTGPMRIPQNNIFYYNLETMEWSPEIALPHANANKQTFCCRYQNSLFLLDIVNNGGYTFNVLTASWRPYRISDRQKRLPPYSDKWVLFSRLDHIYIKADNVYELTLVTSNRFEVTKTIVLAAESMNMQSISPVDSVVCNDVLYCLSKHDVLTPNAQDPYQYCLESVKIDFSSGEVVERHSQKFTDPYIFRRQHTVKLFGVFHQHLIARDDYYIW